MGQFLMASCLQPIAATPMERLDAAADRLTAVIFAASNVNIALNDFTSQLSEEQKAKLDVAGAVIPPRHIPNLTVRSLPAVRLR